MLMSLVDRNQLKLILKSYYYFMYRNIRCMHTFINNINII